MPGVFIAHNRIHPRDINVVKSADIFECLGNWWAQSQYLYCRPTILAVQRVGS